MITNSLSHLASKDNLFTSPCSLAKKNGTLSIRLTSLHPLWDSGNWLAMNRKTSKKMRGFMCHSAAATAVCTVGDPRSVILPRRADGSTALRQFENTRLLNNTNYPRLVESHRFAPARRRSVSMPSIIKRQADNDYQDDQKPKLCTPKPAAVVTSDQVFQVVVMRVALHCQGCAGKVKKHLSKMEGVTSFSIDLETKRVTVMGYVSPVGVLESISKVKRAEFWPC